MADELKRLVQSRRRYRAHLKRLFTSTNELLERCNTSTPEEDDADTLDELILQLDRKKTILTDLDKQILALTNEDELEMEVLESEELQSEISRTLSKGRRLQKRLQVLELPISVVPQPKDTETHRPPSASITEPPVTLESKTDTVETKDASRSSDTSSLTMKADTNTSASPHPPTKASQVTQAVNTTVRLPRLDLPTFSGNALEWQPFWDGFDAAVHSNPAISEVQKLNYLRSLLRGEASQVVAGFSLTSDNYEHSLTLLKDRYGSSHKLVAAHMQAFIDLPKPPNTLTGLQQFYDTIERHVRSLSSLGKATDTYENLLVPIILNKLPPATRKTMVREHDSDEWTLTELQNAIKKEVRVFESELVTGHAFQSTHPTAAFHAGTSKAINKHTGRSSTPAQRTCVFCKGAHSPSDCQTVATSQARKELVTEKNLCFNCLGKHKVSVCNSRYRCRKCQRKHHTSLCSEANPKKQETIRPGPNTESTSLTTEGSLSTIVSEPTTSASLHLASSNTCLLKTAVATISAGGTYVESNILFDEGSQRSFLTKGLAECLQIQPHDSIELSLSTFGSGTSNTSKFDVATINLHSISGKLLPLTVLIVPTIAAPIHTVDQTSLTNLPYLKGLRLAHPIPPTDQFSITLLIGADQYWNIVEDHVIRGNGPTAVKSKLGYLLSGPIETPSARKPVVSSFHVAAQPTPNLEQFWSVESVGITPKEESTNSTLDTYIANNVTRLTDGSYSARFPWKDNHAPLPTNLSTCIHRTRTLARKLAQNSHLLAKYNDILADQEQRGFIEKVEHPTNTSRCHYIPHHAVRKDSPTTPLRIVYDCSCHQARNQPSLNDCLLTGQPQLNDLCSIILRFRLHTIGICTDIEKAFLHISLHEDDRDWTRFLWLSNPKDPESEFVTYRFRVVLFGAVCSPFMLNAALHCHLSQHNSPIAQNMLANLYVDNIVSGCSSESEAVQLYKNARSIMTEAHFNLRSWASNSCKLTEQATRDKVADLSNPVNVLGLQWDTQADTLHLTSKSPIPSITSLVTKREVLKESSKVFDPLGLLSPVTVRAKIFMQSLWQRNLDWDEPLSDEDQTQWLNIATNIQDARSVQIPRQYFPTVNLSNQLDKLHVFADASLTAYGAVAFICRGNSTSFVMAKSRVAPLKPLTLPKLELMGALTAVRLCNFILQALHPLSLSTCFWSDSQIVLHWIQGEKRTNTFVANRISEIHHLSEPHAWRYCPTQDNPADLLTRGITTSQLKLSELWKHGPQWLACDDSWPTWQYSPTVELQALAVTATEFQPSNASESHPTGIQCVIDISKHSTLSKLLAVSAYVLRFIANCRAQHQERSTGPLTPSELCYAEVKWVKTSQQEVYSNVLVNITTKSRRKRNTLIRQLRLFLDDGLLRCGGRIHNAPLSATAKFPLLLPPKHHLTSLIILDAHVRLFHAGTNSTLTMIRQKFWIPTGRQRIKSILLHCTTCRRHMGKPYTIPDPAPLPEIRTRESEPFEVTGIDFTGAMYVRHMNSEAKVYVCLFTCATSRAIHLEVVTDLTVETFLLAFRRFSSRKSLPQILVSDNASTYTAAAEDLQQLLKSDHLTEALGRRGVQWRFIPKRAPWYGGWWERLIGLTKMALKKVLGRSRVSLLVLQTLVVEVEAILNNRPLTYVSSELDDDEPLTPSHLLHGRRIVSLPHEYVMEQEIDDPTFGNSSEVTRRAQIQAALLNQFWFRWRHEYLTSLREHHRASGNNDQRIKQGDVVLVYDESPRISWRLAVVEELLKGNDGLVRAANIRTTHGRTNRPIAKLIPLEVSSNPTASDKTSQSHDKLNSAANSEDKNSGRERPKRRAAERGMDKVKHWIKELGGPPEGCHGLTYISIALYRISSV